MRKAALELKCLLFDLGGVLIKWEGIEPLVALTGGRLNRDQARLFWLNSKWVRVLERGRCTPEEFAEGALLELEIDLTPADFLDAFRSWDRGPFPGSADLLRALRPRFTLACLTNNNELHWRRRPLQELVSFFHRCYASFEIGLMKPDREAYEYVVSDLSLPPRSILFFDDNPECVLAAREVGLHACVVKGPTQVRQELARLGIDLPPNVGV
jgi:HAD superfamily hydrolase (TIGR01509 family)